MSTETESSLATRPSLLARLKDWSQQTAWREFDNDYKVTSATACLALALKIDLRG
jgi:hypothetical protein